MLNIILINLVDFVISRPMYDRRRGSMGALQGFAGDGRGTYGRGSSAFLDTVEASYRKSDVAKELSDLVIYTEAKKFSGFKVNQ